MKIKKGGRRQFLKNSAALGLTAGFIPAALAQTKLHPNVLTVNEVRARGQLSSHENTKRVDFRARAGRANASALTPLQDLNGVITPSELHFIVDHENGVLLDIDPKEYRLKISGMVDRPMEFTLEDLKRLPSASGTYVLSCGANGGDAFAEGADTVQITHGKTSTSEWSGVTLKTLLEQAGVQKGATWVMTMAMDPSNHTTSVPMEKAMDGMTMAAYAQNGESIRIDQGYPVRLVVPGYTGRWLTKWLAHLVVTNEPHMTRQDGLLLEDRNPDGKGFVTATDKTRYFRLDTTARSVITFPSGGHKLPGPGYTEIRGLAWTGGMVEKVDVSTDGGKTWVLAELQQPILPYAHNRFRYNWNWDGKECIIQSRCTDTMGYVQPRPDEVPNTYGKDTSEQCASVMGDLCNRVPRDTHNSSIMSWKIAGDGSVTNPMLELYPELKNDGPAGLGSHSGGHAYFPD